MSRVGTDRADIAAALASVPGVAGYPYRPAAPRPGDAWPILPSFERQDGIVWRPTWTILVALPADERGASDWVDAHFDDIVAALQAGPIYPETAEPTLMATGAGDMYVLQITGRS